MAKGPRYSVPYKRKRTSKTDYKKRLALLKSSKPRLVVRRTLKRIIVQIVKFKPAGDETVLMVSNKELNDYGFTNQANNTPAAYLTGYLAAKQALKKGVKEAVFDTGVSITSKGNRLYAALAGAVEAGLKVAHNPKVFPAQERLKGEHIKGFNKELVEEVKKNINAKVK